MTDAEKALVMELGKELVDKFLPEFIAAEEEHIPEAYQGLVKMMLAPLIPQLQAFLDAKVEALGA